MIAFLFGNDQVIKRREMRMNLRKAGLMGLLALTALAFAAPSASASWLHNHQPIGANQQIHLTGSVGFGALGGTTTCNVTATVTAEAGTTTGLVTQFNIGHHNECQSTSPCVIEEATALNLPWIVHIETTTPGDPATARLKITNATVSTKYTVTNPVQCPFSANHLNFPEVIATPNNAQTFNLLTVSAPVALGGSVKLTTHPSGVVHTVPASAHGTLVPTDLNTWGIS